MLGEAGWYTALAKSIDEAKSNMLKDWTTGRVKGGHKKREEMDRRRRFGGSVVARFGWWEEKEVEEARGLAELKEGAITLEENRD